MLLQSNSTPPRDKLGPGSVRNTMMAHPPQPSTWDVLARLSEKRCIQRRCKSIRVSVALKIPRWVTVTCTVPWRIAAAYASGSVKVRTGLDAMSLFLQGERVFRRATPPIRLAAIGQFHH